MLAIGWLVWYFSNPVRVLRGAYGSWKVVECEIQIFQTRKVMDNQPNGCCILAGVMYMFPAFISILSTVRLGLG